MEDFTKKVAPGKINHKNPNKSCQIFLSSSKDATERPSSGTVVFLYTNIYQAFLREQWTKSADFRNLMLLTYL